MQGFDTYITAPSGRIDFIGEGVSLSTGHSLEVKSEYGHDGTGQSQSLTRRVRNLPMTGTVRWTTAHTACMEASTSLFDYIATIEELCGATINIMFNGIPYNNMLVTDAGISLNVDTVDIIQSASLSLTFTEAETKKGKTPYTAKTKVTAI